MNRSHMTAFLAALLLALSIVCCFSVSGFADEPEEPMLSPRAEAFRDRLISNAQTIYNREMSGFSSAANCMNTRVNHRKQGYVEKLMEAKQYNLQRDFVFDMTELGVNVCIAGLSGNAKRFFKKCYRKARIFCWNRLMSNCSSSWTSIFHPPTRQILSTPLRIRRPPPSIISAF